MGKYRFMSPGDIFICDFEGATGSEQKGKRPIIVVSDTKQCAFSPTVQIVPVTGRDKMELPTHYLLYNRDYPEFNSEKNIVLCEQILTVDKGRLGLKIGKLSSYDLYNVVQTIYKDFPFSH